MTFSAAIQGRISERRLIALTNDLNTATTIDTDVLDHAIEDAVATFVLETGINADDTNSMHIATMVRGAMFYLEEWKGRDAALIENRRKGFFAALKSIRDKRKILPQTDSVLETSLEQTGARPDMDRSRNVWKTKRGTSSYSDYEVGN